MTSGGGHDVQLVQFPPGGEFGESFDGGEKPFDLGLLDKTGGESAELVDVLFPCERPGAEGGCASATAISSLMTVPSVRVISTDPPKAFSEISREW